VKCEGSAVASSKIVNNSFEQNKNEIGFQYNNTDQFSLIPQQLNTKMNTRTATQLTILLRLLSGKKQILLLTQLLLLLTQLLLLITKVGFVDFAQFVSFQIFLHGSNLLLDLINLCLDLADLIFYGCHLFYSNDLVSVRLCLLLATMLLPVGSNNSKYQLVVVVVVVV
jgi:hypothetical protein